MFSPPVLSLSLQTCLSFPFFLPSLHPLHPSPPHHALRFQWRQQKTKWEVSWILHLPCCLINGETPFSISWAEIAALSVLWARQAVPPSCSFPRGHYFCYLLPLSTLALLKPLFPSLCFTSFAILSSLSSFPTNRKVSELQCSTELSHM